MTAYGFSWYYAGCTFGASRLEDNGAFLLEDACLVSVDDWDELSKYLSEDPPPRVPKPNIVERNRIADALGWDNIMRAADDDLLYEAKHSGREWEASDERD